jgi:hypothetical protein
MNLPKLSAIKMSNLNTAIDFQKLFIKFDKTQQPIHDR